jgi:hypothetical protein
MMANSIKRLLWITSLLELTGCIHYRDKSNYEYTVRRNSNLYIEVYRVGLIGNITAEYLTDSTNFRIYLGSYDDEQSYIFCKLKGDSVIVEKIAHGKGLKFDEMVVGDNVKYNLADLKKDHIFE